MEVQILKYLDTPLNTIQVAVVPSSRIIVPELEQQFDVLWEEQTKLAKQQGKTLFNSINYRYESFDNHLLCVSEIDYKIIHLLRLNKDKLPVGGTIQTLGCNVAVGGYLITADEYFVFAEPSGNTMNTSAFDFVGGLYEQDKNGNQLSLSELYLKEIYEEAGIFKDNITSIQTIGLIQNSRGTVVVINYAICNLTKDEIQAQFDLQHDHELKSLLFIKKDKLAEFFVKQTSYHAMTLELLNRFLSSS
jgi:hypothetical protein